jgi:hypothetical protein
VAAFVLSYRLKTSGYSPEVARVDALRAMRVIRSRAGELGIDPDRLGMMGFSAGAHLSSRVAAEAGAGDVQAADPIDRQPARPNFVILAYPPPVGVDRSAAIDHDPPTPAVDPAHPPVFMFSTAQDTVVPADLSIQYYRALKKAGVEVELHIFGHWGPHGLGLASGEPAVGQWPSLAWQWLKQGGHLTAKPRCAVAGRVMIDQKPMQQGWITFIPETNSPAGGFDPVAATLIFEGNGQYRIERPYGPTIGRHRIEVRHLSIGRVIEPSVMSPILYKKASPGGRELTADIREGENGVDIEISSN